LTDHAVKIIMFTLAGLLFVGLSKILPTSAALLAIAITVGVLFRNNQQFIVIANRAITALGGKPIDIGPGIITNPHTQQA
jgi:hypothetical protein